MTHDPNGSDRPGADTGLDNDNDGDGDTCEEYAAAWDALVDRTRAELEDFAAAWDRMAAVGYGVRQAV